MSSWPAITLASFIVRLTDPKVPLGMGMKGIRISFDTDEGLSAKDDEHLIVDDQGIKTGTAIDLVGAIEIGSEMD